MRKFPKRLLKKLRSRKNKISIHLIPISTSGVNCRTRLPALWPLIRRIALEKANRECEICYYHKRLHCHEIFDFDLKTHIQKLVKFQILCHRCHAATHPGQAARSGNMDMVMRQFTKVHGWKRKKTHKKIEEAFAYYNKYIKHVKWNIDLSYAYYYINDILEGQNIGEPI